MSSPSPPRERCSSSSCKADDLHFHKAWLQVSSPTPPTLHHSIPSLPPANGRASLPVSSGSSASVFLFFFGPVAAFHRRGTTTRCAKLGGIFASQMDAHHHSRSVEVQPSALPQLTERALQPFVSALQQSSLAATAGALTTKTMKGRGIFRALVPGRGVGHGDNVRTTLGTAASDSESGSGSPGREAPGVRPSRPSLPETRQRSGFHGSMTSHSLVRYRKRWDQYESPLRPETQLVWILLRLLGLTARLSAI
ncbi:hypothetical protein CCHR01_04724 [Colletotrichum chrysophilum]|uniref:Uncharacterized protein n=1 Tax=Colletotrichum chrysophilum TaxID=1836956 RepID=A0AAD9AVQ8_9PEZI|nr:hypothetical protein CCHR01_04724 [Colletotrichum chrysophilum]